MKRKSKVATIRTLIKLGNLTPREIADKMKCTIGYVYRAKYLMKKPAAKVRITAEASTLDPVPEQTKPSILHEAHDTIYGRDRQTAYGPPKKHFSLVALLWMDYLNGKFGEEGLPAVRLDESDVCILMVLLKVARLTQTPGHHDSQVDGAGYFGLLERVQR